MPFPVRTPISIDDELFEDLFDESGEDDSKAYVPRLSPEQLLAKANSVESLPLTRDQEAFVLSVLTAMEAASQKPQEPLVLEGPAGTGKTTTLLRLIRAALEGWGKHAIRVAAFTHKACSVLGKQLATWEEAPVPSTLHSLLFLKPNRAQYGQPETFSQTRFPNLGEVRLLLIDECSMVGADLFSFIKLAIDAHPRLVVVFAGDPHQLQPVGENRKSKTFMAGIKHELTAVLRHDGAILNQATRIRTLKHVPQLVPGSGGGSEVVLYKNHKVMEQAWIQKVIESSTSDDPHECVMLCYTNDNRRRFNDLARKAVYGPDVPLFQPNDVLVTLSAYELNGLIALANNEDVVVESAKEHSFPFPHHGDQGTYQGWYLTLKNKGLVIPVLNPDEAKRFKRAVKALGRDIKAQIDAAQAAKNTKLIPSIKRRWTTEYFPDSAFFAEVDFRFALTIHKSQGSTYQHVFVTDDYLKSREEAKSLMYVAVTRAAKSVHHVDNRLSRS